MRTDKTMGNILHHTVEFLHNSTVCNSTLLKKHTLFLKYYNNKNQLFTFYPDSI